MTLVALLLHLLAIPTLAMYLLFAVPAEGWRHVWKRLPLFICLWTASTLLALLHVCGHILDEIFFPRYRTTPVNRPVFILGIPRSGTTYLQRLLDKDARFTTLATWEAILAPSITERYLYRALGRLFNPFAQGVVVVRRKLFRDMDTIHRIRLQEPEEDFLLLIPLLGCLLFAFVCPGARHFWRLGKFDRTMPTWYRNTVMTFYRRCLQKHLFFHGKSPDSSQDNDLILLSKNPTFTSLAASLLDTFPEARLIACTRAPAEVVPSQLSSLRPAMAVLGNGKLSPDSQNKMIGLLYHYYSQLAALRSNPRMHLLPMTTLQSSPETALAGVFAFLSLEPSPVLMQAVSAQAASHRHTSNHHYSLADFSLTRAEIETVFRDVWPVQPSAPDQDSPPA